MERMSIEEGMHADVERPIVKPPSDSSFTSGSSADSSTPMRRLRSRLSSNTPTFLLRVARFISGPGKETPLSPPKPWLRLTLTLQNREKTFPLEPIAVRATRCFTSPFLLAIMIVAYIVSLSFFARAQWYQTPAGSFIDCTSTYWAKDNGCGLDGQQCGPFNSTSLFEFRCPAACPSVILANQRAVGAEEVRYVPLVVGGGDSEKTYRGDSWICVAAVQAGVITTRKGGCGALELIGSYTNFLPLDQNGVRSVAFPSTFPLSFRFATSNQYHHCLDERDAGLAFNILVTALLFFVLRPKAIVLFWCLVCVGFWHITFFSDPRSAPPPISDAFGAFLPALFVAYAFWRSAFRFVLPIFAEMPIERGVWYLGAFWPGVLFNIIADRIPIDRLVASDISQRPGAITALVIIVIVIFFVVLNQVRVIRNTGLLPRYLGYYILGGLVILVLSQLPGLTFRLHHYVFAMLLIPGTAFPTRMSAIIQAFLLGTFLNGVSRWGFDSILQTAAELRRDAPLGSSLPAFSANLTNTTIFPTLSNTSLTWQPISEALSQTEGWNGFSLLVDDVERAVGAGLNYSLSVLDWSVVHFFRLAYQKDGTSGDYTRAAMIFPNGSFVPPLPGPS